jgi:hypothetical protein
MLNTKQREIAIRLYDNKLFGTTYGKGMYRKAIYNGSIDIKEPSIKLVIDMYNYNDWQLQAKSEEQQQIAEAINRTSDKLYSWLYKYDSVTREKTFVYGFCMLDMNTNEVDVHAVFDEENSTFWKLEARPCKPTNDARKVPQLLATNSDLSMW